MIDLIVFGTWEYEWMVPPHAALLARHAPGMRMVYYGDRQVGDLPGNVEFRRSPHLKGGKDWDWAEDDWGPRGGFGVGFRACMEDYGRDVALFTFGDFWPASNADTKAVEGLAEFVLTQPGLMRVQVAWEGERNASLSGYGTWRGTWRGMGLMSCPATDKHHGNMGGFHWLPSLWNVPLLLDFLVPECSHWGFEATHQVKMHGRPDLWSCWPRPGPTYFAHHAHDRKEPGASLHGLDAEDREIALDALRPGVPYRLGKEQEWKEK